MSVNCSRFFLSSSSSHSSSFLKFEDEDEGENEEDYLVSDADWLKSSGLSGKLSA